MNPIEDLLAALVAHLRAQPVVSSIVGARVFGMELPEAEARHMPRHALVLQPSGGAVPGYAQSLALDSARIDIYSYGPTPFEAMRLRRATRAAMREVTRVRVGTTLLHWALPAGGYAQERDAKTRWPLVWESFTVLASERAAA